MKGISKKDLNIWPTIAVFDIEATDWVNVYIVGHVDEFGNKKAFKSIKGYMNWLFWNFNSDIVWAHYGGKYDVRFIIAESVKQHGSWKTFESGGTLVITNVFDPVTKRTIKFCDSARLLPSSVAKIGKMVDLPKLDEEIDRSKMGTHDIEKEIDYCIRDCEIIVKGLQYLRDVTTNVNCDFAFTLASMASRWVRRSDSLDFTKFLQKDDLKKEDEQFLLADEFSQGAYFGGRVEVFKRGKFDFPLYYYDIRSSYPASMLNNLPAYFIKFEPAPKRNTEKSLRKYLSHAGITEAIVEIEPDTQYIPVLPVVYKNKLIFPEGKFKGRWTNIELLAALDRGAKITPIVQARYTSKPFLRHSIETFYKLRQNAIDKEDKAAAYIYKIFLNSLYGKLAEMVNRTHTIFGDYEYAESVFSYGIENIYPHKGYEGVYEVRVESRGPFRHVAAGAYITAYSRLLLLQYLEQAISLGGNIYYSDTDSLVTDIELPKTLDKLGNLKLEETFIESEFLAPKVYRGVLEDGKSMYKVKGIPVTNIENRKISQQEQYHRWLAYKNKVYPEVIDKPIWNKYDTIFPNTYWCEEYLTSKEGITGFKTDLRKGRIDPQATKLIRVMRNEDSKREHTGNNSKPLILKQVI
jgi:hypothetical protein